MERLSLVRFDLQRRYWWALAGLLLALGLIVTGREIAGRVPLFAQATKAVMLALYVIGPGLSGIAAWFAGRERQYHLEELLATTSLPGATRQRWHWFAAWLLGAATVLMLFIGAWGWVWQRGAWGGPAWGLFLDGLCAVTAYVAAGFWVGAVWPQTYAVLLAVVGAFLATILPLAVGDVPSPRHLHFANLSPAAGYFSLYYTPFYAPDPVWVGLHVVWLLAVAGAAIAALALLRGAGARKWLGLAMCVMLGAVCVPALLTKSSLDAARGYTDYRPICAQDVIEICLHPAYAASLPDVATMLSRLIAPLAGLPGAPQRAEQQDDMMPQAVILPGGAWLRSDGMLAFSLTNYIRPDDDGEAYLVWVLAWTIIQAQTGAGPAPLTDVQATVAAWLAQQAGYELLQPYPLVCEAGDPPACPDVSAARASLAAAQARLTKLEPDSRRAWLAANFVAIRQGQLSLANIP